MKVNIERIHSRLEEIYQCGKKEDGTFTRMAYSPEDVKGRETFMNYFRKLGIEPRVDEAGNIHARLEGEDPTLPAIMTGSHLDTVPDGGKYDGVVGCVSGLEAVETLVENGKKLRHPLEVIVFTDEEGFRFGSGLLGSSAICGQELDIRESDVDLYGNRRSDVIKSYGITVADAPKAKIDPKDVHCFMELHVEQGASLYKSKTPIGVVSSIAGVSRYEIVITGEANHAGSTIMADRKDALVAASKFIAQVPEIVRENGNEYTVATVGTIKVQPNSVNVVPGSCVFNLEIRDQHAEVIECIEKKTREYLDQVCKEMGEEYSFTQISYHEPAPMSEWVKGAIEKAVQEMGVDYRVVPSGAFHDSLIMTGVFPTGMIFVPSVDGISHSRYEFTEDADIEQGAQLLLNTILEVDNMDGHVK
nr:Zn-dependent hydrolase [uncultured Merdimonas sp.]